MVDGLQQHTAGAASGIVDRLSLVRVEDVHHEADNGSGGVELAGFLIRSIGKALDEIFVGLPEEVGLRSLIPEGQGGEVLDKVAEELVREAVLIRPLSVAEDAVEGVGIRLLDAP